MSGTPFFLNILNTYAHLIFIQPITVEVDTQATMPFTRNLSHSALYKLEQYDETLADICKSSQDDAASSARSARSIDDTTYNPASVDNSYSSTTICSYDHHDLKQLECLGSGAYCRVSKVRASNSCQEVMANRVGLPCVFWEQIFQQHRTDSLFSLVVILKKVFKYL